VVSSSGNWAQSATVFYILENLTDSAAWAGVGSVSSFGPAALLGPVGGWLADRHPRRRILIGTQSVGMLAGIALWLLWITGWATPGRVVPISLVSG